MRALVTGATGFVGPHLLAHLHECGDEVVAPGDAVAARSTSPTGPRCTTCSTAARPEVVYHLAAFSDVGASWRDPTTCLRVNVEGTANVLDAARAVRRAARARGRAAPRSTARSTPTARRLDEAAPLRPITPYGASKVAASFLALQAWLGAGLETVRVRRVLAHRRRAVRPVRRPRARAAHRRRRARTGGIDRRVGAREPVRDLSDVRDVVRAYRLLVEHGAPGEVYNVCSGTGVSIGDDRRRLVAARPAAGSTSSSTTRSCVPSRCPGSSATRRSSSPPPGWSPELLARRHPRRRPRRRPRRAQGS